MNAATFSSRASLLRSMVLVAASLGLAAGSAGCFFVGSDGPPVTTQPTVVDTGAMMDIVAGSGAGVYVEYASGGGWKISTTCDTKIAPQNGVCTFDITLSTSSKAGFSNVKGMALESDDAVALQPDGTIRLHLDTTTGIDVATFDTTPGATVRVEALLAGAPASSMLDWVKDGVVENGARSEAVDFTPSDL